MPGSSKYAGAMTVTNSRDLPPPVGSTTTSAGSVSFMILLSACPCSGDLYATDARSTNNGLHALSQYLVEKDYPELEDARSAVVAHQRLEDFINHVKQFGGRMLEWWMTVYRHLFGIQPMLSWTSLLYHRFYRWRSERCLHFSTASPPKHGLISRRHRH